jgi:hypothetical protein
LIGLPAVGEPLRRSGRDVEKSRKAAAQPQGEDRCGVLIQSRFVMDVAAISGLAKTDVTGRMEHMLVPQGVDIERRTVDAAIGRAIHVADILVEDALPVRLRPPLLDRREV